MFPTIYHHHSALSLSSAARKKDKWPRIKGGLNYIIIYPFLQSTTSDGVVWGVWWDPGAKCSPSGHEALVCQPLNIGTQKKTMQKCLWGCWQQPQHLCTVKRHSIGTASRRCSVAAEEMKPRSQESFRAILLAASLLTWCPKRCVQSQRLHVAFCSDESIFTGADPWANLKGGVWAVA